MATHSGILAWRIPWTEEPGGLQSVGPQRHDWVTSHNNHCIQGDVKEEARYDHLETDQRN